ncbi:hypothetical protein HKD37_05G011983 [Glycine soja]|nr:hypothetical protein JHK87_011394 [Glycine soja]
MKCQNILELMTLPYIITLLTQYVHTVPRVKICAPNNTQIALSHPALLRFHSTNAKENLIQDSLKHQLDDSLASWTPFLLTFMQPRPTYSTTRWSAVCCLSLGNLHSIYTFSGKKKAETFRSHGGDNGIFILRDSLELLQKAPSNKDSNKFLK